MPARMLLILFLNVLAAAATAAGPVAAYPRPDLLLEPAELAKPSVADRFQVLDTRSQQDYAREHVPSARWVDHAEWSKSFQDGQDASGWSQRIGQLGIASDTPVVIYDDNRAKDAARIWWILRYWGVQDVRLLNGGWKQWAADDRPTSSNSPPARPVRFVAKPQAARLADAAQILESLPQQSLQIVDARSENEFCGIAEMAKRSGAIPGAKHLEWSELLDPQTDRFKSPAQLQQLYNEAGIDLQQPSASHCQSGGRASVMAFALELMGARQVRNYHRGWSDWGNREDTPVATLPPESNTGS